MNEHEQVVTPPPGAAFERHYSCREIAELWGFGVDVIRKLFENDPEVIKVGHQELYRTRKYVSLRIPESAVRRVHHKLTSVTGKPI